MLGACDDADTACDLLLLYIARINFGPGNFILSDSCSVCVVDIQQIDRLTAAFTLGLCPDNPTPPQSLRPWRPIEPVTMSLVHLAHVCSHLNNATKARLGLTSIPNTKLHLSLSLALQNDGFVSSVVRGGKTPPPPHLLLGTPAVNDPVQELEPVTQKNIASRRLWLGLKYWQSESVLGKMVPISKPTRRINLDLRALRRVVNGEASEYVEGIRSPGESLYLSTDRGIMEARECVEKKVGGLVLCRVL